MIRISATDDFPCCDPAAGLTNEAHHVEEKSRSARLFPATAAYAAVDDIPVSGDALARAARHDTPSARPLVWAAPGLAIS